MPLFPYSRQPEMPYKRNGLPRRVPVEQVWANPAVRQRVQMEEERYQASLRRQQQLASGGRSRSRDRTPSPGSAFFYRCLECDIHALTQAKKDRYTREVFCAVAGLIMLDPSPQRRFHAITASDDSSSESDCLSFLLDYS
jgi:hypothetical protein